MEMPTEQSVDGNGRHLIHFEVWFIKLNDTTSIETYWYWWWLYHHCNIHYDTAIKSQDTPHSSNYPKWGETIFVSDTHNSNHNDVIFLVTNLSIVPPTKENLFFKAISITGANSENTTSVTAEVHYITMSKWDQPLWAGWEGKKNQLKQACCKHCIKVTTNDHVLPSTCIHLITVYHNCIIHFINYLGLNWINVNLIYVIRIECNNMAADQEVLQHHNKFNWFSTHHKHRYVNHSSLRAF